MFQYLVGEGVYNCRGNLKAIRKALALYVSPQPSMCTYLVGRFARIDSRFERTSFLRIDLPKNGIAARIGRESREFQCESERRRDSCESGQVLQNWHFSANRFARICQTLVCELPAHYVHISGQMSRFSNKSGPPKKGSWIHFFSLILLLLNSLA